MLQKIIIGYLLGIIVEIFLNPDSYFFIFLLLLCLSIFVAYKFSKGQDFAIKDMLKLARIMLIIIVMFTSASYTNYAKRQHKVVLLNDETYPVVGKIVEVKLTGETQKVVVKVDNLPDIAYLDVNVSPLTSPQVFDDIKLSGNISLKNWQEYYDHQPLMFSYEYENIFHNSMYSVSYPSDLQINSDNKSWYETIVSKFYSASKSLQGRISEHMSEPYAGIAMGVGLGNQDGLIKSIKDIFVQSGLIHVLVLSGANIALVISIIWFWLRKYSNRTRVTATIFLSWLFVFFTGLTAPSIRAGTMTTTNILAEYFGKSFTVGNALLVSLFVLTIFNPLALVYSPSLHLSFLACIAVMLIAPEIESEFEKLVSKRFNLKNNLISFLLFMLSTLLAIFVTLVPYVLALTNETSLFGTFLTFLVEPLIVISTFLSFGIILVTFVSSYVSDFLGYLNTLVTYMILEVAKFGAYNLPTIQLHVSKTFLIFYYLVLFTVIILYISKRNTKVWN